MSKIEESVAIGNVPADDVFNMETGEECQLSKNDCKTTYRVSTDHSGKPQFVINLSTKYLLSKSGILNIIQIFSSLACLLALTTSGVMWFGHDRDDRETWWWRYRLLVFVSAFSLLISLGSIAFRTSGLVEILPIDCSLYDLVIYVLVSVMHTFAGSLVLQSNFDFHHSESGDPPSDWSHRYMAGAVVFSYLCVLLYVASSILALIEFRQELKHKNKDSSGTELPQRFQLIQQQSNSTVVENT